MTMTHLSLFKNDVDGLKINIGSVEAWNYIEWSCSISQLYEYIRG